eukprot:7441550-Alexandrium_andersonii.AAC.1
MQYEEVRFGYPNGTCMLASWRVGEQHRPGTSPPVLRQEDVRAMEPGSRQLALRTAAISGRHGVWRGQLAPGEFVMCAVAAGGQVRLEAPGEVLRIVVSRPA